MCIGKNVSVVPTNVSQNDACAQPLVVHAAGDLREPVVDPAEDREDGGAEDDEVEVRDDEVRVGHRLVERDRREHDPGQAAERRRRR